MKDKFEFSYSAPTEEERREIEAIQSRYSPKTKSQTKIERLRQLDNKVKNAPTIVGICLGVIGLLVFGVGLTMALEWNLLAWGIVVGLLGCVPMGFAYFAHNKVHEKMKKKYSGEILKLSEELLHKDSD